MEIKNEEINTEKNKKIIVYKIIFYALLAVLSIIILVWFLIYAFDGSIEKHWKPHNDINNVTHIYIVDAENAINYYIIKEIPINSKKELIDDICKISYVNVFSMSYSRAHGIGFVIEYDDNSYDIVTGSYPQFCVVVNDEYIEYNHSSYRCDNDDFTNIIVKYLID